MFNQKDKDTDHNSLSGQGYSSVLSGEVTAVQKSGPTESALVDSNLSSKQALLLEILKRKSEKSIATMDVADRTKPLPLSWAQQQMWFISQVDPGASLAYHIPLVFRLNGKLNKGALSHAFAELTVRHEILRTNILTTPAGDTYQQIRDAEKDYRIETYDTPELRGSHVRDEKCKKIIDQVVTRPFDLSCDTLFRSALIMHSDNEHSLILVFHHIITDGLSLIIFAEELSALYGHYAKGTAYPLVATKFQYADYAVWQRNLLQGDDIERERQYWQKTLKGTPVLELPSDRARPPVQSYRGGWVALSIDTPLVKSLKELGQKFGCTLFIELLAAFKILLHRYTGQADICVGTATANRSRPEVASSLGFFVNMLALRSSIDSDLTIKDVVAHIKDVAFSAFEHQTLPFGLVVEAVQPQRSPAYAPLFQATFILQNAKNIELVFSGIQSERMPIDWRAGKFDISLDLKEMPDGSLEGGLEYASDLFDESTVRRMASHYIELLKALREYPEQKIGKIEFLTPDERCRLLWDWNRTAAAYPTDKCIHQLFEAQAERQPDAVAVLFEGQRLTYRELNERANQLAHYLIDHDVGPDRLVGMCVNRSLEMVIGLLAILKAGGAYVPLDPSYPKDRLSYMLQDANPTVLLTQQALQEMLDANGEISLCLDSQWEAVSDYSTANLAGEGLLDKLAYVIYTSGSTGKPKGVAIEHRGILNRLQWMQNTYGLTPNDKVMQKTPFSFDVSVWEFFWPLAYGAILSVARPGGHQEPDYLIELIMRDGITTMHFVPPMLEMFLQTASTATCASLKRVICSGQALPFELQQRFFARLPHVELHNLYGPTEASVDVTSWTCRPDSVLSCVPIGRPIANIQIHILDEHLNPVPVGVVGELYIAGVGLARGYVNRPELTSEKFIPNPFSREFGARMYKSGDLARYRPDGSIEYVGRTDHQVKIRGFRIELGEIENALMSHESVKAAVVLAKGDTQGDKHLVGFVVSDPQPSYIDLRAHLEKQLPNYMLPSRLLTLGAMPLTPNGKVDRRALETLSIHSPTEVDYVAPGTQLERQLAVIWAEVLRMNVDTLSVRRNFFELGGHSLSAMRTVSKMRDELSLDVSVRDIFEAPTISTLAIRVKNASSNAGFPEITALASREKIAASFAQERLWFLDQLGEGKSAYLIPLSFHLQGDINIEALEQAYRTLLQRHEVLRTTLTADDEGRPYQVIEATSQSVLGLYTLEKEDMAKEVQLIHDYESWRHQFTTQPFKLDEDSLIRAALVTCAPGRYDFLVVMHHIVTDGWSMGIFMGELSILYEAYCSGNENPLPKLTIQYADYAAWQRMYLQGDILERQATYWKEQLRDVPVLELPTDRARPAVQSHRGRWLSLEVPEKAAKRLMKLGQGQGCTAFMCLLAVYKVLLHRYTQQTIVSVGTPIANRLIKQVEPVVGFFVNTLALRTEISESLSFVDLLRRIRDITLTAYEHQLMPFEKVVEVVQPERSQAHSPLFQTLFALQNAQETSLKLKSIVVSPVLVETGTCKFDLTLVLTEMPDGSLKGGFEYSTDLFDEQTIQRMATHYVELLKVLSSSPNSAIGDADFLNADERHQLLVKWNNTAGPLPVPQYVHALFEKQVERDPQARAIVYDGLELSYKELNERANRLAHYLMKRRMVVPDQLVGLCLERSPEMVIAMLAVLKAGGAYVPLDPEYPTEWLAQILEDTRLETVLIHNRLRNRVVLNRGQEVVLDSEELLSALREEACTDIVAPECGLTPGNLAYVIYTSGSTGKPKGVLLEHRGLANLIAAQIERFGIQPSQRILQFASYNFDASTSEIFMALLSGATLCLANREDLMPGITLEATIMRLKIDVATLPPVALSSMSSEACLGLTILIVAGDACPKALVDEWAPGRQFFNAYGPTESTVCASIYACEAYQASSPSIGRPINNLQIYILDKNLEPVPIGAPGELHIAGIGLARGYLNRPDLTSEKFIANPFSQIPGARMYRSGDRAKFLPNGDIQFLGRIDRQVKIRGFRIELEQVQSALLECDEVRDALVLAIERHGEDKDLVAYVVPKRPCGLTTMALRENLKNKLPEYMIPAIWMVMEALPLKENGKVDRKALPSPDRSIMEVGEPYIAPRTSTEKLLSNIWAEVLKVERVGVHDNFFALGGHSMRAAMIVARINQKLMTSISMRSIFTLPTIAQLSKILEISDDYPSGKSHAKFQIRRQNRNHLN
jgi:amino acid adenylation domain-containing protein